MKNIWGGGQTLKKAAHSGKPAWRLLTPAVLFIIPTIPLFSLCPVCFLSSYIDLAVSLYFLSPLYFLSSRFARTQAFTNTYIPSHAHTSEMRTSRGAGAGVSRWKEANLWLDDWVIERVKGQSSKAVSLSTSLTQTRNNAETQEQQPDPELEALELASSFECTVLMIILMVFMGCRW